MRADGIRFFDLTPALARKFGEAEMVLAHDYTHPNRLGHRLSGEAIHDFLLDLNSQ